MHIHISFKLLPVATSRIDAWGTRSRQGCCPLKSVSIILAAMYGQERGSRYSWW